MGRVRGWWRATAVAASALAAACGGDQQNAFDRAQNMPCDEWQALSRVERARQVGVLRDMQNPSDALLVEVESECTGGRDLAKALLEANLELEARDGGN